MIDGMSSPYGDRVYDVVEVLGDGFCLPRALYACLLTTGGGKLTELPIATGIDLSALAATLPIVNINKNFKKIIGDIISVDPARFPLCDLKRVYGESMDHEWGEEGVHPPVRSACCLA